MQKRNAPCACGSGKKYKQCCARQQARESSWKLIAIGLLVAVAVIWGLGSAIRNTNPASAPAGKVWNAEHGHFHDAPPGGAPIEQPQGQAPLGKIWSAEHGHYHDAPLGGAPIEQPQGQAPLGQIWSAEHGHYHDAPLPAQLPDQP